MTPDSEHISLSLPLLGLFQGTLVLCPRTEGRIDTDRLVPTSPESPNRGPGSLLTLLTPTQREVVKTPRRTFRMVRVLKVRQEQDPLLLFNLLVLSVSALRYNVLIHLPT